MYACGGQCHEAHWRGFEGVERGPFGDLLPERKLLVILFKPWAIFCNYLRSGALPKCNHFNLCVSVNLLVAIPVR